MVTPEETARQEHFRGQWQLVPEIMSTSLCWASGSRDGVLPKIRGSHNRAVDGGVVHGEFGELGPVEELQLTADSAILTGFLRDIDSN